MTGTGEEARLVGETARALFADHCTPESIDTALASGWDEALWAVLADVGLTLVSIDEAAGGSGGSLLEAAAMLRAAGEFCAPVPVAETALLGGWLLATAGLPLPAGSLSAIACGEAGVTVTPSPTGYAVQGRLHRVPWARCASRVALLARPAPADSGEDTDGAGQEVVVSLAPQAWTLLPGTNVAGEPRDDLLVDVTVEPADIAPVPPGTMDLLARRAALARTVLIAGAAEHALALTVRYTSERTQFGRPIGRFQAVQQQVAELAGEVAVVRAAADTAVAVCVAQGLAADTAVVAVAAAKATASRAAGVIARIAHQMHGAIGFTHEHALRLTTTRLWAWRDEAGNEATWYDVLGDRALAAGPDGLWPMITMAS